MEENSSPSTAEQSDASSPYSTASPGETIEQYLERITILLSLAWERSLGAESEQIMRRYMSPDFSNQAQTFHENPFPYTKNLDEHIKILDSLKRTNPNWRTACFNFTASVHHASGHGVVWFTSGPSGAPGNAGDWTTNRESVSKLYWRKKEDGSDEWECYTHECIRGPGEVG